MGVCRQLLSIHIFTSEQGCTRACTQMRHEILARRNGHDLITALPVVRARGEIAGMSTRRSRRTTRITEKRHMVDGVTARDPILDTRKKFFQASCFVNPTWSSLAKRFRTTSPVAHGYHRNTGGRCTRRRLCPSHDRHKESPPTRSYSRQATAQRRLMHLTFRTKLTSGERKHLPLPTSALRRYLQVLS